MKQILFTFLTALIMTQGFSQTYKNVNEAKGLEVGTKAPLFTAVDAENTTFDLADALEKGPVVIIFYRGHWCPVCNKHLGQIQDSLSLITEKGATVVAISPEKPEYLEKMEEKSGVKFSLLYDEDYKISDAYDVTFLPDTKQIVLYNTMLNAKLKESHSDDSQRLPIPATYIINTEGKVVWRQFDPDYKNRSTVKDILNNLPL
ncbi:MAG: AhpC/TSA family protein [Prolixibacteraceae bacterium]|nr:AhpC/TSA family protein [Prolixibacteraceae bacterium]